MEQIRVSNHLVVMVMCFVCLWCSVVMCSEPSDALIKTYVSSSLPVNDDLVDSANLKVLHKITESEWDSLVMESRVPVMVLYTDEQCGPHCERLQNIMENLDEGYYNGKFKFYTVDRREEPSISYGIYFSPFIIVFKGGYAVDTLEGYFPGKV
ncbi:hypothetical protein AALP_AA4G032200 [Arabis alpina]|uniref:Thioredoxin domain-containing protein n=1 Tax=Arabis alpina TaxID=50452 RepID=A0A087H0V3_ARAAL|nr:hypothetical protein AALP_AA4G032200 [Arabis alpina]